MSELYFNNQMSEVLSQIVDMIYLTFTEEDHEFIIDYLKECLLEKSEVFSQSDSEIEFNEG
jgi:hypothetical protein